MNQNRYYLFVYASISPVGYLYNVCVRDNQNMSLWHKDGDRLDLVHYWEFERISGKKQHAMSFYSHAHAAEVINSLLAEYDLTLADMVKVIGTDGLGDTADNDVQVSRNQGHSYHSLCHLYSGLMMDTGLFSTSNILALEVDGGPDNVIDTLGRSKPFYTGAASKKGIVTLQSIQSPGILWVYMKYRYKMQEGSLMALGSAVNCQFYCDVDQLFQSLPDLRGMKDIEPVFKWFEELVGRVEQVNEENMMTYCTGFDTRFSEWENQVGMVVQIIQKISIRLMERNVEFLLETSGMDPESTYLSLTGGYALNCPTNSHLLNKYGFLGLLSPPCVSDTGMSLGMALYYFSEEPQLSFSLAGAFYGNTDTGLDGVLGDERWKPFIGSVSEIDMGQFVQDVRSQPIIWFDGRAEIGPRALGDRSILANPTNPKHKSAVNEIKQRQWWRPVAPIVLEEHLGDWFEKPRPSPYMLLTFLSKENVRNRIQSVLHLNHTARVQTVQRGSVMGQLIDAFQKETGVPILCNTSLNDKGEPIIDTIAQALNFALRKQIAVVYINHRRVVLRGHEHYRETKPLPRSDIFQDKKADENRDLCQKQHNPEDISRENLVLYLNNPELGALQLTNVKDVKYLNRMFRYMQALPG